MVSMGGQVGGSVAVRYWVGVLFAIGCTVTVAQDGASESGGAPPSTDGTSIDAESVATLLQEIGARRRVNVIFPNPQSMFDGLQVGLVNLSSGNLSFRRRDLVVWARN